MRYWVAAAIVVLVASVWVVGGGGSRRRPSGQFLVVHLDGGWRGPEGGVGVVTTEPLWGLVPVMGVGGGVAEVVCSGVGGWRDVGGCLDRGVAAPGGSTAAGGRARAATGRVPLRPSWADPTLLACLVDGARAKARTVGVQGLGLGGGVAVGPGGTPRTVFVG